MKKRNYLSVLQNMRTTGVVLLLAAMLATAGTTSAQVAISGSGATPDASAMLDVQSTTKGLLPPRMTEAQRDAISNPATGLMIYNTDSGCLNMFDGSNWGESCFTCVPQPTAANAGPDQIEVATPATLAANTPSSGSGSWSIISGSGGALNNASDPGTTFSGTAGETYTLRWTITTGCGTSQDDVTVSIEFPCPPSFTDARDGSSYTAQLYDTQCWMTKNLAYLPSVVGSATGGTGAPYYYVYNYNGTSVSSAKSSGKYSTCGVLYNYQAAISAACPSGWHLPTDQEWKDLEIFLGMSVADANTGGAYRGTIAPDMKATSGDTPSFNGNNSSGFKAGACGWRDSGGGFANETSAADFWSTSTGDGWRRLAGSPAGVGRFTLPQEYGVSIRCVKD